LVSSRLAAIAGLAADGTERTSVMVRLRYVVTALALGTCAMGCSFSHLSLFHCDECDDFPTPAYGPGYSMAPGSYTGAPEGNALDSNRAPGSAPSPAANPPAARPGTSSAPENAPTPPPPPAAAPPRGADARQPASAATDSPETVVSGAVPPTPTLPYSRRSGLQVPVARSGDGPLR
jgi:hypothetical protein